jgi:PAS domain S-box-containing protein
MAILASTGFSKNPDSFRAGVESAKMVMKDINEPNVIILFASVYHNHEMVLKGIREIIKDVPLIGGSAYGEMTNYGMNDNSVALMAIKADKIKFSFGLGNDSDQNPEKAGQQSAREAIKQLDKDQAVMGIFTSEMLGGTKTLDGIQNALQEGLLLFGGCCSGNRKVSIHDPEFTRGYQYFNDKVYRHSVPLMLLSGDFKYSFGVGHGWRPLGKTVKVGKAEENKIYELDNISALDFYKRYLEESSFVPYPLGFYHNDHILLRAVTGVTENGGLNFTTNIAPGTDVRITIGSRANIFKSSRETAQEVLNSLGSAKPKLAIVSSCISRRTMLGARVHKELEVIQEVLGKNLPLLGGYCAGEFAPVSGKNFYHNFSFCLCLLGEQASSVTEQMPIEIPEKPETKRDKVLIITQNENLASDCRTALTGLEIDFQSIKNAPEIEESLKINTPQVVILDSANVPLIQKIKEADQDIQIILLIEKDSEKNSGDIIQKLGENICGFCHLPIQGHELQFLVNKALSARKLLLENKTISLQLAEAKESLDEAEEHIEVTERVVMASYCEIESAHDYINNVIKSMMDSLIVTDPIGKINTVNEAALNLLGYNRNEFLGMNFESVFADEFKEESKKLIAKDQVTNHEISFKTKNGREIPVLLSSSVMIDKKANITAIVYTAKDITERKKAEQQLQDINQELKNFAYVVSHDLKAPLRGIKTLAEWLSTDYADKFDDEGKDQINLLMNRVGRMHNLIDGILQYSRVGRVEEEMVAVNLNELVTEAIDTIAPPENITITVENELPVIECDRTRIMQVFQNLLSNAVKYMDKPKGRIEVGCIEENGFWKFSVTDNGPGIEEKYFEKIFQLFQTLAPRDESESTGIGLTVTKKIVEMYGGKIWVQSKVGEATIFFFTLPIQKIAAESKELLANTVG